MTRPNVGDLFPIGAEGDAQPEDVRSGRTFSNEDETGIEGSMANRSGHVTAQSRSRIASTLRFRPQPGYYDGSTANSVQFSDGQFVAGNILKGRSIFGLTGSAEAKRLGWSLVTSTGAFGTRSYGQAIVYDQKLWFMGGFSNDTTLPRSVWYTTNGTSWTQATTTAGWAGRYLFGLLAYDNKLWVFGGFGQSGAFNDVWYTTNGASWTQATSSAAWTKRHMFGYAVFDNKMWLTGGSTSSAERDVWYSTNGSSWTQGALPGWSAKRYHEMAVYDNKMWVVGGWFQRDVWYTTNGTSWTQATGGATWGSRSGYSVEVYDNKMWVYGGSGPGNAPMYNDVWYTTNGSAWTQVYESADWPGRANGGSAVFDDGLWLMAGWEGSYRRDIWYGNIRSDGMIY